MDILNFIKALGFLPKENASDVYIKKYQDNYYIEIDFAKSLINYGKKIKAETKTTQNFSQPENFVVLECVNRLLEKGYKPENIVLEKVWRTGHGTSGRLDVLVTKDDGSAYMMIECKNHGADFKKEFKNIEKNGGQIFTYFQQDRSAEILMLYSSYLDSKGKIHFENQIIKIEEDYRQTTNVKDFYERWNKIPKNNGVFEEWVNPYHFESKAITPKQLKSIKQEDSSFIFNRFLEILRHNVVSDKPNAFNKIFTLFLCKVYDEKSKKENEELEFQWLEGKDDEVSFQLRLNDLYKKGMLEFLDKEVADLSEDELDGRFASLFAGNEQLKSDLKKEIVKLRLEKNNEFAIKEVFDNQSFIENAKIVKEVVELLQGFRIRYNKRQQYLSDFFELLLTTGLKQESGQFFTPVPIAQFVIKSLPLDKMVNEKLEKGEKDNLLPNIIDYAAGSGHFLTESMHEIQGILDEKNPKDYIDATAKKIKNWQDDHFDWATQYVYGIEKDYRLVKVGKVGCYLHGDGLANVILSDGLGSFSKNKEYKRLLKKSDTQFPMENKQFDAVISNPPYSVASFKNASSDYYGSDDFELYERLTDNSSEIECLFIERTKQLLKDGGVAGIILPSSILSNTGIYTKAREIILKYFEIIGITELGSNTFMATGTNTVTLFLRRRNNYESQNFEIAVEKFFTDFQDVTINTTEKIFSKYINQVWEDCTLDDYKTLMQKTPNEKIKNHERYKEYRKKLKAKNEGDFWKQLLETEKEKLFYFILVYPQKVVVVKSGTKNEEKRFLGYEFSNRRGSEGIHPIQRGKTIEECTQLFDEKVFDNPEKASTYIYDAFNEKHDRSISENLKNHVHRMDLVDMLTFDRVDFEKNISTSVKKKVKVESKWDIVKLGNLAETQYGYTEKATETGEIRYLRITDLNDDGSINIENEKKYITPTSEVKEQFLLKNNDIVIARSGSVGKFALFLEDKYEPMIFASYLIRLNFNEEKINPKYFFNLAKSSIYWDQVHANSIAVTQPNLNAEKIKEFRIPLPPLDIQQKIVSEIEVLEEKERKAKEKIGEFEKKIFEIISNSNGKLTKLEDFTSKIGSGATPLGGEGVYKETGITFIRSQNVYDGYFTEKGLVFIDEKQAEKLENVAVEKNDILFNITGASIARCCVVEDKYLPARVNQHVSIIRVNDGVSSKYVQLILSSSEFKSQLLEIGEGATSRQAITKSQLENFQMPLPPLSEQEKIVSEIEKIETEITALENHLAEIPAQKEEILKKYL